jgi:hypothetical protein
MNRFETERAGSHVEDEAIFSCSMRRRKGIDRYPVPSGFSAVSIGSRDLVESHASAREGRPSELSFINLFMWRTHYRFSYALRREALVIRGEAEGKGFMLEPLGSAATADTVAELLASDGIFSMERTSESFVRAHLEEDSRFSIEESRDHWDYIYARNDLARLAGRKYHRKRNHVKRFMQRYAHEYVPLGSEHIPECREIVEGWCRERNCEIDPVLCAEREAVEEVLSHFENLDLLGGLLRIDGKPVAFTIGEAFDGRTALIHVEKALSGYEGLYQAMNKLFCESSLEDFEFVNREQDLGIEGLRKSKESYFPVTMLKKYRVMLRTAGR